MYDDVLCMNLVDIFLFQIFDGKMAYNDKLISLRDWKLQVIDKVCHPIYTCIYTLYTYVYNAFGALICFYPHQISSLVSEIEAIQSSLHKHLHKPLPPVPVIKREEVPEKRLEYTKDSLLVFKEQLKAKEDAERQAAATGADGGFFGGFGGEGSEDGSGGEAVEEAKDESDECSVELSRPGSTCSVEEETLTPLQAVLRKEQQVLLYTVLLEQEVLLYTVLLEQEVLLYTVLLEYFAGEKTYQISSPLKSNYCVLARIVCTYQY